MNHTVNIKQFNDGIMELESSSAIARQIVNTGAAQVEIRVIDTRNISRVQREKAMAIVGEIALWSYDNPDYIHIFLKHDFCIAHDVEPFSLSDCDMTTARLYITYLIDFCIYHGVPTKKPLYAFCDDIEAYIYSCLCYRKCAVTGRAGADIHHCTGSRVGIGRDRREIIHEGLVCIPLVREMHDQCHLGELDFLGKHHLRGLPLDKYLCGKLGLNTYAD